MKRLEGLIYIIAGIVALLASVILVPISRLVHHCLYKRYPYTTIIRKFDEDLMEDLDDQYYICIYTIGMGIYQLIKNKDNNL